MELGSTPRGGHVLVAGTLETARAESGDSTCAGDSEAAAPGSPSHYTTQWHDHDAE
jgi:hypothetical protein